MSNYNFSNTLDGLNNIESTNVDSDNINTDYLTVNINSSVPLITPHTTSSNQIASCAFVQNAFTNNLNNYVTLNTAQTITGNKTFNGVITRNNTTNDYSDYRFISVQGGGEATQIYQVGGGMTLTSITNNKFIVMNTRDISGNAVNNVFAGFGNQAYLQGALNNRIDITGTLATIGGTSVPRITTQPITSSNTNEIASTAFVKTNLSDYVTLGTAETITANKTFNGTTTLNNLFVSNYVDLTLTTYENQFYGDIYGYRGVVCQNGFYVKDTPGAGGNTYALIDSTGNFQTQGTINATGSILTSGNIAAQSIALPNGAINDAYLTPNIPKKNGTNLFSGTNNFLTGTNTCQTRPTATDDTTLANTAFVKNNLLSYVKLNNISTNQTLSGTGRTIFNTGTTFNDTIILNSSTDVNNTLTFNDGVHATQFDQTANNLTVYTTSGAGIKMGSNYTDNIVCSTNRAYLQGSSGNTIDMNVTQATIGGTSVPRITTQPLSTSNTNEIATTQWTKTQLTGTYAVLNGSQDFVGQNVFSNTGANIPLAIKTNTPLIGDTAGFHYIGSAGGEYNAMVQADDYVIFAGDKTGNESPANLVLTTWGPTKVGIRISDANVSLFGALIVQEAPFYSGYNSGISTLPLKTNYMLGYQFTIPGSSFTGQNWTTFSTSAYIIQQIDWNGFGNYTLGVWNVEINIVTNCNASPLSHLTWGTSSNTNIRKNATYQGVNGSFGGNGAHIMNLQFILTVTNLTTTYYVNHWFISGTSLSPNLNNSQIVFTRIA